MSVTQAELIQVEDPDTVRRRVRLLVLLNAAENAGLAPLSIVRLHTLAYLANVLAAVWDMPAIEGKVLKRQGGPFYPAMQRDLDRLVGLGMVTISNLSHVLANDQRWRLEGSYRLNQPLSASVLRCVREYDDERRIMLFSEELAYALSALSDTEIDVATMQDATYADPLVDVGDIIDFEEWNDLNYSANAARCFRGLIPGGGRATPGEMLHLYVRHLQTRLHGGR
jgi:hypothetical protein